MLTHAHVELNADGVPIIAGTTMKVVELVAVHLYQKWGAEELHEQFPYLTLGQIYSALSYFYDHEAEVRADLARREQMEDEIRRELGPSPIREKLLKARENQPT